MTSSPCCSSSQSCSSTPDITQTGYSAIKFEIAAPGAKEVSVAGSFNGWRPHVTRLKANKNGVWSTTLELADGRYEYRYVVDGEWRDEQRPCARAANPFGGENALVEVCTQPGQSIASGQCASGCGLATFFSWLLSPFRSKSSGRQARPV